VSGSRDAGDTGEVGGGVTVRYTREDLAGASGWSEQPRPPTRSASEDRRCCSARPASLALRLGLKNSSYQPEAQARTSAAVQHDGPRSRFLMLRDLHFAPKGQPHTSRGRRPRTNETRYMSQALKGRRRSGGRHVSGDPVAPFQGFADWWRSWVPRALPWAGMWLPLRGDGRTAQPQNSRFGSVRGSMTCVAAQSG
jgi:hypothetical protein